MGTAAERVTGTRQCVSSAAGELIVQACGWSREIEEEFGIEAIIAGDVAADRYWIATQDGRGVIFEWQQTAGCGREVYYERWTAERGYSHGWVDAESRRIVQTG